MKMHKHKKNNLDKVMNDIKNVSISTYQNIYSNNRFTMLFM